jgi:hypothetical protein
VATEAEATANVSAAAAPTTVDASMSITSPGSVLTSEWVEPAPPPSPLPLPALEGEAAESERVGFNFAGDVLGVTSSSTSTPSALLPTHVLLIGPGRAADLSPLPLTLVAAAVGEDGDKPPLLPPPALPPPLLLLPLLVLVLLLLVLVLPLLVLVLLCAFLLLTPPLPSLSSAPSAPTGPNEEAAGPSTKTVDAITTLTSTLRLRPASLAPPSLQSMLRAPPSLLLLPKLAVSEPPLTVSSMGSLATTAAAAASVAAVVRVLVAAAAAVAVAVLSAGRAPPSCGSISPRRATNIAHAFALIKANAPAPQTDFASASSTANDGGNPCLRYLLDQRDI